MQADRIYCGDALTVLKTLPDNSVNCCVTSPPYYALRDYGVDGQIGREETPALYVERLTSIFREVRRVLTPDGTLWLNIADTYAGKGNQGEALDPKYPNGRTGQIVALNGKVEGCKAKDMIGVPWMLAFALRADGWYLRSDIIWQKANPMPESVTDALRDAPGAAALSAVHREIREHEQDNVGVESAHGVEQAAERAVRLAQHAHRSHKEKPTSSTLWTRAICWRLLTGRIPSPSAPARINARREPSTPPARCAGST